MNKREATMIIKGLSGEESIKSTSIEVGNSIYSVIVEYEGFKFMYDQNSVTSWITPLNCFSSGMEIERSACSAFINSRISNISMVNVLGW